MSRMPKSLFYSTFYRDWLKPNDLGWREIRFTLTDMERVFLRHEGASEITLTRCVEERLRGFARENNFSGTESHPIIMPENHGIWEDKFIELKNILLGRGMVVLKQYMEATTRSGMLCMVVDKYRDLGRGVMRQCSETNGRDWKTIGNARNRSSGSSRRRTLRYRQRRHHK